VPEVWAIATACDGGLMTRLGLERIRVRVFIQMLRAGASKAEAFAYIELMYPFEELA
jgi:hypothetical protein